MIRRIVPARRASPRGGRMSRRCRIASLVLALAACLSPRAVGGDDTASHALLLPLVTAPRSNDLLISALLYDGVISGEADEGFELHNPAAFAVPLDGWRVTNGARTVTFAGDLALPAGASLWCAREAEAFRMTFGHPPACEYGADTDPAVPNLSGTALQLGNAGGRIELRRPDEQLSDVVVYKGGSVVGPGWQGASVTPYTPTSAFHEYGQILHRKHDEVTGWIVPDTDSGADWASDPHDLVLGRQVKYPGWATDRFFFPASGASDATLQVIVAPDHSFDALQAHLGAATRSIVLEGYTLESPALGETLIERARAGVAVTLLLEGGPPGGVSDQQRWLVQRLHEAGARVSYMRSASSAGIHDRYLYQHAKLWLLDDRLAIIGSENPSPESFPHDDKADGTLGRRGVMLVTDAALVLARVREIMAADMDASHRDIWPYDPDDSILGRPPDDFTPSVDSGGAGYAVRFGEPLTVQGRFAFEVCQSPEHSLRTHDCLLGLAGRARAGDQILVEQLDEPAFWGPSSSNVADDPNPRLEAYLDAARRGAQVRLLLDAYYDDLVSSRSNLRTAEYLTSIARAEGLDLDVRRGNPAGLGLHNKMVVARIGGRGWVMAGSPNGGEVSAKLNREVALVVGSDAASDYLAALFWHDWALSQ